MKLGVWTLIFAFVLETINAPLFSTPAFAVTTSSTSTSVATVTQTDTSIETITSTSTSFSTNISVSQEPGNQLNSQQNNQDNNNKGSDQSSGLGMAAIAAGMAMVAAGMAMMANPQTQAQGMALVAAGMAMIASGMAALKAADKMANNANRSGQNAANLGDITGGTAPTPISLNTSTKVTQGTGGSPLNGSPIASKGGVGSIKIDPSLLRNGKIDTILTKMEQQTGISREALSEGLNNGVSPVDMLAHAPSLAGNKNASAANLNSAFNAAQANGLPSAEDVMGQLGLSPEDLGGVGSYDLAAGGAGGRGPASSPSANFEGVFGAKDDAGSASVSLNGKVSSDVQAQLDYRGLPGGRTIFEMVHAQYRKKTPMMWGSPSRRFINTGDNPFGGLTGDRIDLSGP